MSPVHLHLLRGDDTFSIEQRIKTLIAALGDDFDPAMNLSKLDGKTASLEDIRTSVSTLPFFGSSRLVILESALNRVDKGQHEKFLSILDSLPPVNHLVLVVTDHPRWRKDPGGNWARAWETLTPAHWLIKALSANPCAEIIDEALPAEREMDRWISNEVKRQGGVIGADAASELVQHVGNDTSVASQEIAKLLIYVDFKRPVSRQDVLELVSEEGSVDVFKMLDLWLEGNLREAQAMMHRLLDDQPAEVILGAVIHRFRTLIQVREVLDERGDLRDLVNKRLLFGNQVDAYSRAARRFPMARMEEIYRRLLEIDLQSKTSQKDLATGLELLVIQISK